MPQVAASVVLKPGWLWQGTAVEASISTAAGRTGASEPTTSVSLQELQELCRASGLAGFKLPRYAMASDSLPRNTSGKVLKHVVRQELQAARKIEEGPSSTQSKL